MLETPNPKYSKTTVIFGHNFKNPELLQSALTHPSMCKNNEFQRLEFLGDRILNLEVALMIFNSYKTYTAGQMSLLFSSLVCGDKIYEIGKQYILPCLVSYGKITKNVIADTFEAVIAALFFDGADVKKIVYELWNKHVNIDKKNQKEVQDISSATPKDISSTAPKCNNSSYKSTLNLIGGDDCVYTHLLIRKDDGSYFQSRVTLHTFIGFGVGKSKKEADEKAAESMLQTIYVFSSSSQ